MAIALLFGGGGLALLSLRPGPRTALPVSVRSFEPPAASPRSPAPEPEPAAVVSVVDKLFPKPEVPPPPLPEPQPPPRAAPSPPVAPPPESSAVESTLAAAAPDRGAVKVFSPKPEYPEAARLAGDAGTVVVEAEIDPSGAVSSTRVLRGVSPALDQAAQDALGRWRFEPATRGGRPASDVYRTAIHFELEPPAEVDPEPAVANALASESFEPPVRLFGAQPRYPPADWLAAIEGDVILQASINETGQVTDVEVLQGLSESLDQAAVDAVEGWRFRPARRQGQPVASDHVLTFRFAR